MVIIELLQWTVVIPIPIIMELDGSLPTCPRWARLHSRQLVTLPLKSDCMQHCSKSRHPRATILVCGSTSELSKLSFLMQVLIFQFFIHALHPCMSTMPWIPLSSPNTPQSHLIDAPFTYNSLWCLYHGLYVFSMIHLHVLIPLSSRSFIFVSPS